jgi:hypothetical protein
MADKTLNQGDPLHRLWIDQLLTLYRKRESLKAQISELETKMQQHTEGHK